ncbi:MAG: hypothetical protein IJY89_03895 [Clostridia bacterium]|nr:hypothetical protein [Clostridia bacterium]
MKYFLKISCLLFALLFALTLFAGCLSQSAGVTVACIGYSAAELGGSETLSFENKEQRLLPGELVRSAALLAAVNAGFADEQSLARVIFDYDAVYMKAIVMHMGGPTHLLEAMNDLAHSLHMNGTVFGSITGTVKAEGSLYAALELETPAFAESKSTTSDLLLLARALYENEILSALYAVRAYAFPGEPAPKTRNAPLLRPGHDCHLENARFYVGGTVVDAGGKVTGLAIAAVAEEGKIALSAVADHSGLEDPIPYMAADAGNLCGKVLGKNYGLNRSPEDKDVSEGEGTVFLGTNLFYVIVFLIIAVVVVLGALVIVLGIVNTMKRNIEGRRKYAAPKDTDKQ